MWGSVCAPWMRKKLRSLFALLISFSVGSHTSSTLLIALILRVPPSAFVDARARPTAHAYEKKLSFLVLQLFFPCFFLSLSPSLSLTIFFFHWLVVCINSSHTLFFFSLFSFSFFTLLLFSVTDLYKRVNSNPCPRNVSSLFLVIPRNDRSRTFLFSRRRDHSGSEYLCCSGITRSTLSYGAPRDRERAAVVAVLLSNVSLSSAAGTQADCVRSVSATAHAGRRRVRQSQVGNPHRVWPRGKVK